MRGLPDSGSSLHSARTAGQRISGCLKGVATGDAVGKQTETLAREAVRHWYPNGLLGFEGSPGSPVPRYIGNRKREWVIGEATDDTERTMAVARAIIRDRRVSRESIGREMLTCRKSVHPGVPSLWDFHQANDPARVALKHDGCGAAIRVAPVGIVCPSSDLARIVAAAREASVSTHGGAYAIAAAGATAAAVSGAIDGATGNELFDLAAHAAALSEERWPHADGPRFAHAMRAVRKDLAQIPALEADAVAERCFPATPLTIVPLALALATLLESAERAILLATNVGGDADSVASIAGAVLGAAYPDTVNEQWYDVVERINHHDVASAAMALALLRSEGVSLDEHPDSHGHHHEILGQ